MAHQSSLFVGTKVDQPPHLRVAKTKFDYVVWSLCLLFALEHAQRWPPPRLILGQQATAGRSLPWVVEEKGQGRHLP